MRVFVSAVVTAIVLFFFGFLWWGILMPVVRPAKVISDATVVDAMSQGLSESGIYFHPDYGDPEAHTGEGPMVIAYFFTDQPNMGQMMGGGFIHMVVTAFLASWIVAMCKRPTFGGRVAVVFVLGLFVAIWADIGNMIWWRHPPMWTAFHFAYDILSWLIAGLIIATIVKPATAETPSADA